MRFVKKLLKICKVSVKTKKPALHRKERRSRECSDGVLIWLLSGKT